MPLITTQKVTLPFRTAQDAVRAIQNTRQTTSEVYLVERADDMQKLMKRLKALGLPVGVVLVVPKA